MTSENNLVFDQTMAREYDQRFQKIAAMREALHLCIKILCQDAPEAARVLVVGAGTGLEIADLAKAFPRWRFTAVDPSPDMLAVCRQRCETEGIEPRCDFHEGYLNTMPATAPYDIATSLLVSHFITEPTVRRGYFEEIAGRLRPGGRLINADLAADMGAPDYPKRLDDWLATMRYNGATQESLAELRTLLGTKVALLAPAKVAELIAQAGFAAPTAFFQVMFMHAWHAQIPPTPTP